jgi:hypothetical protein
MGSSDSFIYFSPLLPPPSAKMRWPEPNSSPAATCERRPGEQQFGRASDAQSGVDLADLGQIFLVK